MFQRAFSLENKVSLQLALNIPFALKLSLFQNIFSFRPKLPALATEQPNLCSVGTPRLNINQPTALINLVKRSDRYCR